MSQLSFDSSYLFQDLNRCIARLGFLTEYADLAARSGGAYYLEGLTIALGDAQGELVALRERLEAMPMGIASVEGREVRHV